MTGGKEINDTWWAGMCERMAEANKRDMFDDIQYVDVSGVCALMNQGCDTRDPSAAASTSFDLFISPRETRVRRLPLLS